MIGAARLGDRALPRPRAGEAAERAVRRDRDRPAARLDGLRHAHGRRLAARRDARDAVREHPARAARDARAADRGGARGLGAAAVALGQVRHRHLARRARRSRSCWSRSARSRSGIATGPRLLLLGVGVLLLFFGVSMNAPKVVRPLAAVLGAPARDDRRRPGHPRARQRDPEPGAHRLDRLGADDRPRAGHLRRDLRRRASAARSRTPSTSSSSPTTRSPRRTPSRRSRPQAGKALVGKPGRQRRVGDPRRLGALPRQQQRPDRACSRT